jgi:hypothetical protein
MKKLTGLLLFLAAIFNMGKTCAQDVTTTTTTTTTVTVTATTAPPDLPVYEQPACPVDGYLWVPGYWAWDAGNGYYWVPGVWVAPPDTGLLWTPAYWGFADGVYGFHEGYWGAEIGYYGGINYGYGYGGVGFVGGGWSGGVYRYNTAIVNVNTAVIHNTYEDRTVITASHVHSSFNGPGGAQGKPTDKELKAMNEKHVAPTVDQASHQDAASKDRNQYASMNRGRPASAAMKSVPGARAPASNLEKTAQVANHPAINTPAEDKKAVVADPSGKTPMNANEMALANRAKQKASATASGTAPNYASNPVNKVNTNTGPAATGVAGQARKNVSSVPQTAASPRQTANRQVLNRQPAAASQQVPRVQQTAAKPQVATRVAQAPKSQPVPKKKL